MTNVTKQQEIVKKTADCQKITARQTGECVARVLSKSDGE